MRQSRSVITNVVATSLWGAFASFGAGCPDGAKRRGYSARGFYEMASTRKALSRFIRRVFSGLFFGFFFLPLFSFLCGESCEELGVGVGAPLTTEIGRAH